MSIRSRTKRLLRTPGLAHRAIRVGLGRLSPRTPSIVRSVIGRRLTYLDVGALNDLYTRVHSLERNQVTGSLIEAGCALGGSALVMAAAKDPARAFYVYDVFDLIPPPTDFDGQDAHDRYRLILSGESEGIAGEPYYGYVDDLMERVRGTFREFGLDPGLNNIHLVKGPFEKTLWPEAPIALAHLDCDWYESVMTCLQRIHPRMVKGGSFIVDDYHAWSGSRRAVDDFLLEHPEYGRKMRSRLHLEKP